MTDFEKWLKEQRELCKRHTRLSMIYQARHFPKALRMLEVAVKALEESKWASDLEALTKINEIAKEK